MYRVFVKGDKYCAVRVGNSDDNFTFTDWRDFTSRLKRVMEHEAAQLLHSDTIKTHIVGASEIPKHGERRRSDKAV